MKTFLSLLAFAIGVNVVVALFTMVMFPGQIGGANTFTDYFYYSVGHLTTSGAGDMIPKTTAVRMWTSLFVLTVWVFVFYVAINQIHDIKFGRFG
jgi:uncharacterized protein (DUF2062 family)